ncbi:hypothetical protein EIP86_002553 [Pleurotus ostreatoroseus]|nr:hypothetical protein EIP86_002553 [Pleurotus ostreatoroseus]
MMSTNAPMIMDAARQDAMNFASRIDLKNISESEARVLMSAEHKALGYRPPAGSLAAEAQAAAAKNPPVAAGIPEEQLTKAAFEDAMRIKKEREVNGVDLSAIGEAQARKLMSEEHKALGHRPPSDSLASQAQAAAAQHPKGATASQLPSQALQRAALENAVVLESTPVNIDLEFIGQAEARRLMSEEHKALGYRPPQGSLAAAAQAAAAKHPHASAGLDPVTLTRAALEDAKKIEAERRSSSSSDTRPDINVTTVTADEAHKLQSEEQKALGYRPPPDSIAAIVQSFVDKRAGQKVTKEAAAEIQSEEQRELGHRPESGSMAATAQSVADQNEADGGDRTFGEAGL